VGTARALLSVLNADQILTSPESTYINLNRILTDRYGYKYDVMDD
jgi:hypothetical protein